MSLKVVRTILRFGLGFLLGNNMAESNFSTLSIITLLVAVVYVLTEPFDKED